MARWHMPSRHRSRNLSPDGLRTNTLPRSRMPPTILNLYEWAGKKDFVSLKFECRSGGRTRDLRLSKQAVLTTAPLHVVIIISKQSVTNLSPNLRRFFCRQLLQLITIWWTRNTVLNYMDSIVKINPFTAKHHYNRFKTFIISLNHCYWDLNQCLIIK